MITVWRSRFENDWISVTIYETRLSWIPKRCNCCKGEEQFRAHSVEGESGASGDLTGIHNCGLVFDKSDRSFVGIRGWIEAGMSEAKFVCACSRRQRPHMHKWQTAWFNISYRATKKSVAGFVGTQTTPKYHMLMNRSTRSHTNPRTKCQGLT
jgi:hypothetical protein